MLIGDGAIAGVKVATQVYEVVTLAVWLTSCFVLRHISVTSTNLTKRNMVTVRSSQKNLQK